MNYRKCLEDAVLLVSDCESNISTLKRLYELSLENKEIESQLSIRFKNTFENLRSALDFCAQAIALKISDKKIRNVYFPYATLNTTQEKFENENRIEKVFPGLEGKRPDLYTLIMEMQHFSHEGAKWFPEFMELNNKNKHVHLVPNEILEGVSLEVDGSKRVYAKEITIGENGSIVTKNGIIQRAAKNYSTEYS